MSLCYDFQKWIIVSFLSITISLTLGLVLVAHGQTVDNQTLTTLNSTDFSIDIPNNWAYRDQSTILFGPSSWIGLTPNEFGVLLLNNTTPLDEKMKDEGAYSTFVQDFKYEIKNAPLDLYVKYEIDRQNGLNVTSKQNVTIDGEPAVKIYADGIPIQNSNSNFTGIKFVQYMLMHDKEPYNLAYMANVKDFEKYLPEFEQIVKTFRFVDKK